MALRLSPAKLVFIRDMIESQSFTTSQVAEQAECNKLTIINIHETCHSLEAFTPLKHEL
jgi:hypothetical protein